MSALPAPSRPFCVGDPVRLVEIDGDALRPDEQLRGVVSRGVGPSGEIEVTFPTRDGGGGFDFWPAVECRLDADPSAIRPVG